MPATPVLPGGTPVPPRGEQPPPPSPRSPSSPRREVAPGTPCAGDAVSARALRLRQARPGGLCCGSVPPACVGCVAGAVCRASARVRGRLGAVTVQRWLRGEGWHGGAALSPPISPAAERWVQADGRSVCPSVRWGGPATAVDAPLPLAVVRGDGKGTRKSMALFCSLGDGWAPDAPKGRSRWSQTKSLAVLGAVQCWGAPCRHHIKDTPHCPAPHRWHHQCGMLSPALALPPSRPLQHHGNESLQCGGPDRGLVPAVPLLPGRAAVHQALPSSVGASVRHAARIYGSRWEQSGRPAHRWLRCAR